METGVQLSGVPFILGFYNADVPAVCDSFRDRLFLCLQQGTLFDPLNPPPLSRQLRLPIREDIARVNCVLEIARNT